MPKRYSSREIERVLRQKGFIFIRQRGSHGVFRNNGSIVVLPMGKKEIPQGTFHSILAQSGLKRSDFVS